MKRTRFFSISIYPD